MTIADFLTQATQQLQQVGIASARLDTQLLLADELQKTKSWLLAHDEQHLTADELAHLKGKIARRVKREPMAYIRGMQEFYGRNFQVNSQVLIPRPDSEALIELFLQLPRTTGDNLLDVGTGSGALAITIKLEAPEIMVDATDISPAAIAVATQNAATLQAKVHFMQGDLLSAHNKTYNFTVANLPYVDSTWQRSPETTHEPALALFAEEHGLALIKKLVIQAAKSLHPGGFLLLEADPRQHQFILAHAATYNFRQLQTLGFALSLQLQPK
jgi:release factor glutamine methyltransferase